MQRDQTISKLGKMYIGTSLFMSFLVFISSVDPYDLTYTFKQTVFELGLWRPFTAVLYLSRVGLLLPFHIGFAYIAFKYAVNKMYGEQDQPGLLWLFILSSLGLAIFSTFTGLYFYGNSFIMILLMMWTIQHPTDRFYIVNYALPCAYLPIIYAGAMVTLGSSFKNYMAGFLLGLLLGIIKNKPFIEKNGDLFPTPKFILALFDSQNPYVLAQPQQARSSESMPPGPAPSSPFNSRNQDNPYFRGQGIRVG